MAKKAELMQEQLACFEQIKITFKELREEGLPKPSKEQIDKFEAIEHELWQKIQNNHQKISTKSPPEQYLNDLMLAQSQHEAILNKFDEFRKANEDERQPMMDDNGNNSMPNTYNEDLVKILKILTEDYVAEPSFFEPQRMEIPIFDGDISLYKGFKETFFRAVDVKRCGKIEMLIHLKSKLSGIALQAIATLQNTETSFDEAWKILDRDFDNPRLLLQQNIQRALSCYTENRNEQSLLNFAYETRTLFANMEQLQATANDVMIEILIPKMDVQTRSRFNDYYSFIGDQKRSPSFEQLGKFFSKEIQSSMQYTKTK